MRSPKLNNTPWRVSRRSILLAIIGVRVSTTKPDTSTAAATVRANSVNSLPVLPSAKASGANHGGQHRAADGNVGEDHRSVLVPGSGQRLPAGIFFIICAACSSVTTGTPGRSLIWPSRTTVSPASTPETISTRPGSALPSTARKT